MPRPSRHIRSVRAPASDLTELQNILRAVRDARFAHGLYCPRCHSSKVQRWGSFSCRQRYRCLQCRRTFSDLTSTAAAYTKRLSLWRRYVYCMIGSDTIRRAAREVGIHPSTAFRWRHRILDSADRNDRSDLAGWIEIDETGFPYSEKGRRNLHRPARTRGYWKYSPRTLTAHYICVVVACDRAGKVVSAMVPRRHPYDYDLREHIITRVQGKATVLAHYLPLSHCGRAARLSGHSYVQVPRFRQPISPQPLHHTSTVMSYINRLCAWLPRFRGVATRYLQHYLAWHRLLDAINVRAGVAALIRSLPHTA
ncbi:MAG: IS1595 family transposase [Longimicrobiales bacterium]